MPKVVIDEISFEETARAVGLVNKQLVGQSSQQLLSEMKEQALRYGLHDNVQDSATSGWIIHFHPLENGDVWATASIWAWCVLDHFGEA